MISYIGIEETQVSIAIPDDVEIYFEGVIGEGVAASQVSPQAWVGSLQNWKVQKGYWVKINIVPDDALVEFQWELPAPIQQLVPEKDSL